MIHTLLVAAPVFLAPGAPLRQEPTQPPPAAAAAAQEPVGEAVVGADAPTPRASRPLPVLLNSIQLIVNEQCITIGDLQRMAAQQGKPATSREEYVRMLEESADQLTRRKLMEQAGRDLGYDENMVRSLVRGELDRTKEAFGSVAALAQELDRASLDSAQLKDDTEDRIYRELWQGSVTGKFMGPGGRPYVDRFVRPGQILLEFERQGASLDLPAKIQLLEMIIAPSLGESPESARQKAELVRSRLVRGEDFYELNATFGIPGRDPQLEPIEEEKLAVVPEIKAFVDTASPGDTSEVVPILSTGKLAGFRILRFVGRQEGKAASFVDREFQTQLTEVVRSRRDRISQDRALLRLQEAAYVWPQALSAEPTGPSRPEQPAPADPGPSPAEPAGA
jgi:hypothetical protein